MFYHCIAVISSIKCLYFFVYLTTILPPLEAVDGLAVGLSATRPHENSTYGIRQRHKGRRSEEKNKDRK